MLDFNYSVFWIVYRLGGLISTAIAATIYIDFSWTAVGAIVKQRKSRECGDEKYR
jgi:hypothetical protein